MLAPNYMTAEALGITERQRDALIKVLGMMERGEIREDQFWMDRRFPRGCRTAVCICGWADNVMGSPGAFGGGWVHEWSGLCDLFLPQFVEGAMACRDPRRAALALRSYLVTGDPCWREAMAAELD